VDCELSDPLRRDSKISEVLSNLMPALRKAVEESRGSVPEYVKPVTYKIQEDPCSDEMDTNYFVKVQVGENEFMHAKIAQDPNRRLSLCKIVPKTAEDEIDKIL